MYMDAPRGLKDEARLAERRHMLETVEHVLVTAGTGVPTSGLILGRDT